MRVQRRRRKTPAKVAAACHYPLQAILFGGEKADAAFRVSAINILMMFIRFWKSPSDWHMVNQCFLNFRDTIKGNLLVDSSRDFYTCCTEGSKLKRGLCEPSSADIVSMCSSVLCCLSPVIREAATPWSESQLCVVLSSAVVVSRGTAGNSLSKKTYQGKFVCFHDFFLHHTR